MLSCGGPAAMAKEAAACRVDLLRFVITWFEACWLHWELGCFCTVGGFLVVD